MISPDGRWLAYISDESGTNEVYVRQFSGKGKWGISAQGGDRPVWSRNRHELFYRSGEGLMIVTYSAGAEIFMPGKPRLWTEKKDLGLFDLAPEGTRFVIVQSESSPAVQKSTTQVTFLLNFFDELRRRAPVRGK